MSADRMRRAWRAGHRFPSLREFGWVVGVATASILLQARGFYVPFEALDLDPALASNVREDIKLRPDAPALVVIDTLDYDTRFGAASPLAADPLLETIEAVCDFRPKVVGIDVLTERWSAEHAARAVEIGKRCPIVWATGWRPVNDTPDAPVRLTAALGLADASGICSAPPIFYGDSDGVVRRFERQVAVSADDGVTYHWTFPAVLADPGACGRAAPAASTGRPQRIRFSRSRDWAHASASVVVEVAAAGPSDNRHSFISSQLGRRIVLIGGTYPEARDAYVTPLGTMQGIHVIASVTTTFADPIREPHEAVQWLVDVVIGSTLLVGLHLLIADRKRAIVAGAIVTAAVAVILSWLMFRHVGYAVGVFGALGGVLLALVSDLYRHEASVPVRREAAETEPQDSGPRKRRKRRRRRHAQHDTRR